MATVTCAQCGKVTTLALANDSPTVVGYMEVPQNSGKWFCSRTCVEAKALTLAAQTFKDRLDTIDGQIDAARTKLQELEARIAALEALHP